MRAIAATSAASAAVLALAVAAWATQRSTQQELASIPDRAGLASASEAYLTVFEVSDGQLVGKLVREQGTGELGAACWRRLTTLFPLSYRRLIVQFNIQSGRRWSGKFDGDGSNDVGRRGYRLSIAEYQALEEPGLDDPDRAVTPRRGTLDWTIVHEVGHYVCLRTNTIELFSESFDGDMHAQPQRREDPRDYPEDGSPRLDGDFVSSYAERNAGDEEAVETFTAYLLVAELPDNGSLVAQKLCFFETMPGFPELRDRIQGLGKR